MTKQYDLTLDESEIRALIRALSMSMTVFKMSRLVNSDALGFQDQEDVKLKLCKKLEEEL
jgi:hypothetical protein